MLNLAGENGKSGNLPWFGKCSNWMTKGAPQRKAILGKMAHVSGEVSGQNLAIIAVGFANIQISSQMGSQKESSDFDEHGESRQKLLGG